MSTLQLKSIELEQFRQHGEATAIEGLESGLCIIAGNNEAGKSTLLQAIRAALFDRYKSSVGEQFRPYGAKVSPRVAITFELGGIVYRLNKVFSRKRDGSASLEYTCGSRTHRLEGTEAEDYLAELLGFEFAKKGGSRSELQGLAGLLWVEQTKAMAAVDLSDTSRRRVQSVFEHEMRELLGGDSGDALHQRITEMWGEYFGKNGPVGAYKKLADVLDGLSRDVESKRAELVEYEGKVDHLESRQRRLQAYVDDNALELSRNRLQHADEALRQIDGLRAALTDASSEVELVQSKLQLAEHSHIQRKKSIEQLRLAEEQAEAFNQRHRELAQKLALARERAEDYARALQGLKRAKSAKDELLRVAGQLDELTDLQRNQSQWHERLQSARKVDQLRREAVASRDSITLTGHDLDELRAHHHEAELARARLQSAATRFGYQLEPGVTASLDGKPIVADGHALLSEPAQLEIEKIGRFHIKPGGDALEIHRSKLISSESLVEQKLAMHGMETLAEAEGRWREKQKFSEMAQIHQASLEGIAPAGISDLEDRVVTLSAKIKELEGVLGDNRALNPDRPALESEASAIMQQIASLEQACHESSQKVGTLREENSAAQAQQVELQRQAATLRDALAQARVENSDETVFTAYVAAQATLETANQQLTVAREALRAQNPELLESELERTKRVFEDLQQEIEELNQLVHDAKVELSALGQKGLSEELAAAEGRLSFAQLEFDLADRQARALDLLKQTLDASFKSAREIAARPITEKLIPYLKQLIPDAQPLVDENMVLAGIERKGTHEPFEELSIGTREQLAILIRLAYADLLSEAGQPVVIILDDALVNSDDDRRDQMKSILYQASKRYQVIILTCHGRDFRDAGGQFIRLEHGALR